MQPSVFVSSSPISSSFAPPPQPALRPLRAWQLLLIGLFSLALFGYCGISGRPLTMHEARLPQTSREMLATHQWLLPHSGIRPWLERPPLPHWFVIASIKLFGLWNGTSPKWSHPEWVVRLPSAIAGTIAVLLTAWMAGRWFGASIGAMSGLVLATSFEFYRYSGSAEDDIYLAALVALCMAAFVVAEFFSPSAAADRRVHFAVGRPWPVLLFFILVGLTNWTKGPLLGVAVVGSSVGIYLLWNALADRQWSRFLRYVWLWGWAAMIALTLAWPLWAYRHYPDVLDNWKYDYLGRFDGKYTDINQPWWYYFPTLGWAMLPWTPACLIGLAATVGQLRSSPTQYGSTALTAGSAPGTQHSALRLLWCWAIVPLLLFSIPRGKHHHYLIPFLAPWAILGAIGLMEAGRFLLARRGPGWLRDPWLAVAWIGLPGAVALAWFHAALPGPAIAVLGLAVLWPTVIALLFLGLRRGSGPIVLGATLGLIFAGYCWADSAVAAQTDQTVDDTAFLRRARHEVPANVPLFINAKLGPVGNLDFFRIQFYSRPDAILLHNLTYLRDENITAPVVYVITRRSDQRKLETLGTATVIDQSAHSHEQVTKGIGPGPFALFRLQFKPDLRRYPAPRTITNMQAMERDKGPWCGPEM